ncbi:sulfur oxidation c-type cytochrome SoxX [Labrenzia sp. CE80]|uniref:sulfur oxidation c-type cytochrome SoxX n=1 Tax=Labrenzia sp. CE80 TaxID=1788986 RepID=UPI00129A0DFF|nr:sulfur oxidation c-type cytochrome SoxX [Labrenzia sp. CE80]
MTKGLTIIFTAASFALAGSAFAETLAPDDVEIVDMEVTTSLTGEPGDAVIGRETFADRKKGNCLACHVNADLSDQLFHGEVGPPLDGVGDRWTAQELRAIVIDSKEVFGEQTIMPGFYTMNVGINVAEKHQGQTILSAQDVEDVVAYLTTLSE